MFTHSLGAMSDNDPFFATPICTSMNTSALLFSYIFDDENED
jgi:hypothetical protein